MDLKTVLALIAAGQEIAASLPGLIASLKGTLSSDDEAALKDALAKQIASNSAKYAEARDMLLDLAGA